MNAPMMGYGFHPHSARCNPAYLLAHFKHENARERSACDGCILSAKQCIAQCIWAIVIKAEGNHTCMGLCSFI